MDYSLGVARNKERRFGLEFVFMIWTSDELSKMKILKNQVLAAHSEGFFT